MFTQVESENKVISKDKLYELCRLCLETGALVDPDSKTFLEKLEFLFRITMDKSINRPKKVCSSCMKSVEDFYAFYKVVEKSEQYFQENFGQEILQEILIPITKLEECHVINNEGYPLSDQHLKEEDVDLNPVKNEQDEKDDTFSIIDEESSSESVQEEEIVERKVSKAKPKKSTKINGKNWKWADREDRRKTDEQIRNFLKLVCEVCNEASFRSFTEVKQHYTKAHQISGYVSCCNLKFRQRYKLLDHVIHHMNPDAFKCEFCGKTFENSKGLTLHKQKHVPDELKIYKCEHCPVQFAKPSKLKAHLLCHVPEEAKPYMCKTCGKSFPIPSMLQGHVRLIHENRRPYVCEICAKSFKTNQTLKNHQLTIHDEKQPRIKCDHCQQFYANLSSLKKHLKRINVSGEVHECPHCGHVSPNKDSLRGHIDRVHRRDRSLFECTICGKGFKVSTNLKEHMASHTGERLYTCSFCPKQFNSNANKYSHQKKKHPSEWEEQTKRKKLGIV